MLDSLNDLIAILSRWNLSLFVVDDNLTEILRIRSQLATVPVAVASSSLAIYFSCIILNCTVYQ
jgi:hypothetical protein